jgi:hypothetical protein
MDDRFIQKNKFEKLRKTAKRKKQEKEQKQIRLQNKEAALKKIQDLLKKEPLPTEYSFEHRLQSAMQHKVGSQAWAFAFLNVDKNLSFVDKRRTYLKLASYWHPDTGTARAPKEAMTYLNGAWEIIKETEYL